MLLDIARAGRSGSSVRRGRALAPALRRLSSRTLQEPEIERREHHDNSYVYSQPLPELVPEEQDVYADHHDYQRDHTEHGGCLSSHRAFFRVDTATITDGGRSVPPLRGYDIAFGARASRHSVRRP
jgi:hypothetical protein